MVDIMDLGLFPPQSGFAETSVVLGWHTSSFDLASDSAWMAGGSSWELSFRVEASSSGNAPWAVNSTSAFPMALDVLLSLILRAVWRTA